MDQTTQEQHAHDQMQFAALMSQIRQFHQQAEPIVIRLIAARARALFPNAVVVTITADYTEDDAIAAFNKIPDVTLGDDTDAEWPDDDDGIEQEILDYLDDHYGLMYDSSQVVIDLTTLEMTFKE